MSESQIQEAAQGAFEFWLSQHPISTEATIEVAVKQAFSEWLDLHTEEILECLEKKLTR
jgi:hypothetical protein